MGRNKKNGKHTPLLFKIKYLEALFIGLFLLSGRLQATTSGPEQERFLVLDFQGSSQKFSNTKKIDFDKITFGGSSLFISNYPGVGPSASALWIQRKKAHFLS